MKSNSRYLGALLIAPFIIFIFLGGMPLKIFTFILSILGMFEFYKATRVKHFKPISIVGYVLLILYYIFNNDFNILFNLLVIATLIVLIVPVINLKVTFIDSAISVLGFLYVGVFLSFLPMISDKASGNFYIWLVFIGAWVTDTCAYYSGKFFGKHKLCPKVSPKKTIEGSIGGIIGTSIICGVYGLIASNFADVMAVYHFVIIGFICGILSQFGDLVASSIKRYAGIKDYSNLIPGHGGILDRFDSILFTNIVVYYYLTFIMKL